MSTISGLLETGRHALTTHKLAMSVIGNNIANAGTTGYARQRLNVTTGATIIGNTGHTLGTGVASDTVSRSFDKFTFRRILDEDGRKGFYAAQQKELDTLDAMFNESSNGGLSEGINDFFSALDILSSNPEGIAEREALLGEGESLVRRFQELAAGLKDARLNLDSQVSDSVDVINEAAGSIAILNAKIATAEATGDDAGNLRSQREMLIRTIAAEVDTKTEETESGSVTVYVGGRVLVQEENANTLITEKDAANDNLLNVLIQSGDTTQDITGILSGGELGGALSLRDSMIPGYQEDLDELAYTLVDEFNTQHSAGFGLDGLNGRNFFEPLGAVAGAAELISLSTDVTDDPNAIAASSTSTGVPGDNANAIALYQLSDQDLVGGSYTFTQSAINQVGQLGSDAKVARDEYDYQDLILGELEQMQEGISGVSVDQEATELLKFQSAFQASAKFISAVQEVMDTLMRL